MSRFGVYLSRLRHKPSKRLSMCQTLLRFPSEVGTHAQTWISTPFLWFSGGLDPFAGGPFFYLIVDDGLLKRYISESQSRIASGWRPLGPVRRGTRG